MGSVVFMIFLPYYIDLLSFFVKGVAQQTALAHILFNIINTTVFLILLTPFEKLILKLMPGDEEEVLFKPKYINGENENPKTQIQNIKRELVYSIENTTKIYEEAIGIYYHPDQHSLMKIAKLESLNGTI